MSSRHPILLLYPSTHFSEIIGRFELIMKTERSNIQFPIWRKKVDSSVLTKEVTPIPTFACAMWSIDKTFHNTTTKKDPTSKVKINFLNESFNGYLTVQKKSKNTPLYRLFFSKDLSALIKETFLMSYMRDIEKKLRKEKTIDIENEIPFWEFLDIEYDKKNKTFLFTPHYTQKPSFPELFKRIIGSPSLKKIDDKISKKEKNKIYKQDWKPREEYPTEIGAENVIYMLIDTDNRLFYIGETEKLIKRFDQGHESIKDWNFYRYDVLPDSFSNERLEIERMQIRIFATLLKNIKDIETINLSNYTLVNEKVDK